MLCQAAAVMVLSLFFTGRTLISILRPIKHPVRSVLIINAKNGRAPPSCSA